MCYGSLDPKQMMRDMDARLKTVGRSREIPEKTDTVPKAGWLASIWQSLFWAVRKNPRKA